MSADADLVMMSKATSAHVAAMTQHAIDTARKGAAGRSLNIIVLEQDHHVYVDAATVYAPEPFNYNAFANRGAKMGQAPNIVIANNDLVFWDGWLDRLIKANHPVVSPYNPGYPRHAGLFYDEVGWQVGRHLTGWCYMISRTLWSELGGLDETYRFWCSDNAVMDQLRAKGIQPRVIRHAVVQHLLSATLQWEPRHVQDDLTWALVHQYNQDRGDPILLNDQRYRAWKRRKGIT